MLCTVVLSCRAGIEVWSKQAHDHGYIDQHAQGPAPGGCSQNGADGSSASSGLQQWQLLQCRHPSLERAVDDLAAQIGPLTTRRALGASSTEAYGRSVARAQQREQQLLEQSLAGRAAQLEHEADKLGAQLASFARTVQKLHFLVDGVDSWDGCFWETGVAVDTHLPPPGFVPLLPGGFSTVSMTLTMSKLRDLFRLSPLTIEECRDMPV